MLPHGRPRSVGAVLRSGKPIVARLSEDVVLVSLPEDLDTGAVQFAWDALQAACRGGAGYAIIDLGAVRSIDPATLALLVRWSGELCGQGGEVVVTTSDPRAARQFAVSGLDRIVRIERTLMQAIDDLVGPPGAPRVAAPEAV